MVNIFRVFGSSAGRNNTGSITVRHRSAPFIKKFYTNYYNFKNYNLARFFLFHNTPRAGSFVKALSSGGYAFTFVPGVHLPRKLYTYRPGDFVNNIESFPSSGAKYARAKYSRALVMRRYGTNIILRIPSGELRKFKAFCGAYPAANSGYVKQNRVLHKAGAARDLGRRPSVRGCAINPVDHPHGGRTGESRPSVSPWAILTKGFRTRSRSYNKKIVLLSVQAIKNKNNKRKKHLLFFAFYNERLQRTIANVQIVSYFHFIF